MDSLADVQASEDKDKTKSSYAGSTSNIKTKEDEQKIDGVMISENMGTEPHKERQNHTGK